VPLLGWGIAASIFAMLAAFLCAEISFSEAG
jgi:hypothetical protein